MNSIQSLSLLLIVINFKIGIISATGPLAITADNSSLLYDQLRLFKYLLHPNRYDSRCDPTILQSINVSFYLELHQLLSLDENSQTVRIVVWLQQEWHDPQLYWNSTEYSDISTIVVPHEDVWVPETYLANSVELDKAQTVNPMGVIISVNENNTQAAMMFGFNAIYSFSCKVNMRLFPFDIQTCTMVFEPLLDKTRQVYVAYMDRINSDYYHENEEWSLLGSQLMVQDQSYVTAPNPYTRVFATIQLQRRPMYYVVSLILPMMLISLFASIGLFVYTDSSECKYEKMSLGMTALLTFSIQLLQVSSQVPKGSSTVPLLSWFFLGMMTEITISTLVAVRLCHPDQCEKVVKFYGMLKCWFWSQKQKTAIKSINSIKKKNTNIFMVNKEPGKIVSGIGKTYGKEDSKKNIEAAHKFCMFISMLTMLALICAIFAMALFAKLG